MNDIASSNPLFMFAQELVGSVLCSKVRPEYADTVPYTLTEEYTRGEYDAMIRATAYACGAGRVYGPERDNEWHEVCGDIRECVRKTCLGFNVDNTNDNDYAELVTDVVLFLRSVANRYAY